MIQEFKIIADNLPDKIRVLDVGCGDGSLMVELIHKKKIDARGLELDYENVKQCIAKGLTVIQGDAETELHQFPNNSFDCVILSQTLQAFHKPEFVLDELTRIGKKVVVSIPNFGYWRVRLSLLINGKMPVTKALPNTWYNTPNLHMCTIKDFYELCIKKKIEIDSVFGVNSNQVSKINKFNLGRKNLFSELGIFFLK